MKRIFLIIYSLTTCLQTTAQVGINTETPNSASILHINSSTQGILAPRIQLTGLNEQAPLTGTIEEGTIVFNKGIAGFGDNKVFSGFYVWKDSKWNSLASKNDDTDYKVAQYSNKAGSTQNFNGTPTGLGTETDIFGVEVFNDDPTYFTKLSDTSLRVEKDGLYIINLNLGLEDQTSNNQIYGVNSNVEIYMGITIERAGVESQAAERILTMVPQFRITGSELISDTTPADIIQTSTAATKRLYTRGKFSYSLSSYLQVNAEDILRLRAFQSNTSTRANGIVSYDPESSSNLTIIKIR